MEQIANLVNSLFNGFFDGFSFGPDVEKLTEHAGQMSQLLQPAKSSIITYIFDDVSWYMCLCVRERRRERGRERERLKIIDKFNFTGRCIGSEGVQLSRR